MDGGPPGEDVLHVDGSRASDGNVSGRDAEAQPLGTCGTSGRLGAAEGASGSGSRVPALGGAEPAWKQLGGGGSHFPRCPSATGGTSLPLSVCCTINLGVCGWM